VIWGTCNRQAACQRTLAPFCSAYGWLITRIGAIRLKRIVTKTADDINITHSGNKHAQLTQLLHQSNLLQHVNRKHCQWSHGSRHFVHKPQSASKIRLVRWPALLETRASCLPTTRYAGQPITIGSQAACRLHAPQFCVLFKDKEPEYKRRKQLLKALQRLVISSQPSQQKKFSKFIHALREAHHEHVALEIEKLFSTDSLQHFISGQFPKVCNEVYITDSVLVNLGIQSSCAIGNNELVVTRN